MAPDGLTEINSGSDPSSPGLRDEGSDPGALEASDPELIVFAAERP